MTPFCPPALFQNFHPNRHPNSQFGGLRLGAYRKRGHLLAVLKVSFANFLVNSLQCMFVQDFPILASPPPALDASVNPTHTSFSSDLLRYLSKLRVPSHALKHFAKYDFGGAPPVRNDLALPKISPRLVWSVQGLHEGYPKMDQGGGICSLANAVASLGIPAAGNWSVELAVRCFFVFLFPCLHFLCLIRFPLRFRVLPLEPTRQIGSVNSSPLAEAFILKPTFLKARLLRIRRSK